MKRLAIIGSGDLGQQIAYHARTDGHYAIVGYYDDWAVVNTKKAGHLVLGCTSQILVDYNRGVFDVLMIGIGYKHMLKRKEFFERYKGQVPFGNILHSSCYIDKSASVGEGVFLYPRCVVDMNSRISDNVFLNISTTIAHDTHVGAHSMLSPSVKLAGFVNTGECVNLGIGTIIIDNISIAAHVQTGAGAVVVKNINDAGLYVGVPAKKIKNNDSI